MTENDLNEIPCRAVNGDLLADKPLEAPEQIRVGRRLLVAAFCMIIVIGIAEIAVPTPLKNQMLVNTAFWVASFVAFFAGLFGINKIGIGTDMPVSRRVLKMLLLVFPYINLLTLIYVYYKTVKYLKNTEQHSPISEKMP